MEALLEHEYWMTLWDLVRPIEAVYDPLYNKHDSSYSYINPQNILKANFKETLMFCEEM